MTGTIPLADFVTLGQQLYVLMNPQNVDVVIGEIPKFLKSLESCGLRRSRTAADALNDVQSITYHRPTGVVSGPARVQIQALLAPIFRSIYAEIGEQVAVAINRGIVSQQLRQLPTVLKLTATQTDLLNETVTCIECGAYRAGVVMGWNLAYEYIRQWLFDNHLMAFNGALTTMYLRRDGTPIHDPISTYDDLTTGKPGERTVIDTCYHASIIGEHLRDNLRFYLRRRNNYAHPTFRSPSADQTNGYIKDLLDTITSSPFKTKA